MILQPPLPTRPPFPAVIDSSLMSAWRDCRQKCLRTYFQHYKTRLENIHLIAGKAFAAGVEEMRLAFYDRGADPDHALAAGIGRLWREYGFAEPAAKEIAKTWDRMAGALEYYSAAFPLGKDNAPPRRFGEKHGIEFSFVEPLDVSHPETGEPLLFSGRLDMVADAMGGVFGYDEKTTSKLGPTWSKQWELRGQFSSYCWGMRAHGIHLNGIVVRGIAILKHDYNHAQAITYRPDWEVDRWLDQTQTDLLEMIQAWKSNRWSYNLDHACAAFGGCELLRVCKSRNPEIWLAQDFERRRWDPVTRTETPLLENEL